MHSLELRRITLGVFYQRLNNYITYYISSSILLRPIQSVLYICAYQRENVSEGPHERVTYLTQFINVTYLYEYVDSLLIVVVSC